MCVLKSTLRKLKVAWSDHRNLYSWLVDPSRNSIKNAVACLVNMDAINALQADDKDIAS